MKKGIFLVLLIFLLACGICFAEGFDLGASGLFFMTGEENVHIFGVNIAGSMFFNDFFGIGIYGNIYILGKGSVALPFDFLAGSAIKIVNTDKFALPVALGFYMFNIFGVTSTEFGGIIPAYYFDLGPGANISAEIKFFDFLHLYLRLQGAYMFLNGGGLVLSPSIGIGF